MCRTCGCDDDAGVRVIDLGPQREHDAEGGHDAEGEHDAEGGHGSGGGHSHDAEGGHGHAHGSHEPHAGVRTVELGQRVLAKNDALAAANRQWLAERRVLALNVMSSPGSGKTTVLERTVRDLGTIVPVAVIEGDQETIFDAQRIQATGCRVVQINTGAGCHLDAAMLADGLRTLDPPSASIVFIENVGNLVCPALFDLGEAARVVVMSVTEGADKPLKYPYMFRAADLVLINKVDLLPYVDFDLDQCRAAARMVNPKLEFLDVSATRGTGLPAWYDWLHAHRGVTEPSRSSR